MAQRFEPAAGARQLPGIGHIEHDKIVAARRGAGAAVSMTGEFEMMGAARQPDHYAVIAVVPGKAVQLGQAQPVTIKRDNLVEPVGRPRNADLRRRDAVPKGQFAGGRSWLSPGAAAAFGSPPRCTHDDAPAGFTTILPTIIGCSVQ